PLMPLEPLQINLPGLFVTVGTVKEDYLSLMLGFGKDSDQIVLGPAGFGKDDGLLAGPQAFRLGKTSLERLNQRLPFGVFRYGYRKVSERLKIDNLKSDSLYIVFSQSLFKRVFLPLIPDLFKSFKIISQFILNRHLYFGILQLCL